MNSLFRFFSCSYFNFFALLTSTSSPLFSAPDAAAACPPCSGRIGLPYRRALPHCPPLDPISLPPRPNGWITVIGIGIGIFYWSTELHTIIDMIVIFFSQLHDIIYCYVRLTGKLNSQGCLQSFPWAVDFSLQGTVSRDFRPFFIKKTLPELHISRQKRFCEDICEKSLSLFADIVLA